MISRDLVAIQVRGSPFTTTTTREAAEQYVEDRKRWPAGLRERPIDLAPVPSCRCCGRPAWDNLRCTEHQGRNPCLVEGCRRTTRAPASGELRDDQWLCAEHWRRYVPPRSRSRRAYNAHFRRAKRYGWTDETIEAFERFWDLLVRRVRRLSTEGALDEAEINRLFGWADPE